MATTGKTTQAFVPIEQIRDGVVILKDGGMRMALIASSLNFALKSADEQRAIILQFQNFLNSLDFSVQIFVQSRKLDIRPYLNLLEERLKEQTVELIKVQTNEYIGFVKNLTEQANIMEKRFIVVVPYNPPAYQPKKGAFGGLFGRSAPDQNEASKDFEEHRTQIEQRASVVSTGLTGCGVRTAALGTEELIELFYRIFNPGEMAKPAAIGA